MKDTPKVTVPKAGPQPKKMPRKSESKESATKEMKETKAGPKNHRMSFCWTNDCEIAAHQGSKLNWLALMQGPEVARCDKISIKSESSVSDTDVTSDDEGFLVESHLNC